MSYSVKMPVLNMEIQFSAADQKDLWRQVSLFQSLPATCPIDDTPARLNYRYVDENDFFEVVNTGPILYKYLLGQYKKGGATSSLKIRGYCGTRIAKRRSFCGKMAD